MMHKKHLVVGWREYITFPGWKVGSVLAKSDTGAKSSAIDVISYEELSGNRVRFEVAMSRKNRDLTRMVEAEISRRTRVRSSNGQMTERLLVMATFKIGDLKKEAEFGLVCRKLMLCRVLLGRTALEDDFLVDSKHKFLLGEPPSVKKKAAETKKKLKAATKKKHAK